MSDTTSPKKDTEFVEPEWKHITKAGQKTSAPSISVGPADTDWDPPLRISRRDRRRQARKGIVMPMAQQQDGLPKKWKVQVNYFVTTYVHIVADSQEDAMMKAMSVEAPHLEIWDNTAHDTKIESEVMTGHIEEIDEI